MLDPLITRQPYAAIIERRVAQVALDPQILALWLIGSLARGDALPGCDIDVVEVRAPGCGKPFSHHEEEGVVVETHAQDEQGLRELARSRPAWTYAFLDARQLVGAGDVTSRLQAYAQETLNAFRADPAERSKNAWWIASAQRKIAAAVAAGDSLRAGFLCSTNAWQVLEGLWLINDRPMPASGGVLAHGKALRLLPEDAQETLRAMFSGANDERVRATLLLIQWVLAHA
jgi:hypothetical protein